jgi:hypothetical protein
MSLSPEEEIILKQLYAQGGTGNAMEYLQYDTSKFEQGFEIVNTLQNKDAIKLLYSNFNKNLIVIEITLWGIKLAQQSSLAS